MHLSHHPNPPTTKVPCVFMYLCVFSSAGINESNQMGLFQVLAAILHLGNVEIKDRDSDSSIIPVRRILMLLFRLSVRRAETDSLISATACTRHKSKNKSVGPVKAEEQVTVSQLCYLFERRKSIFFLTHVVSGISCY